MSPVMDTWSTTRFSNISSAILNDTTGSPKGTHDNLEVYISNLVASTDVSAQSW